MWRSERQRFELYQEAGGQAQDQDTGALHTMLLVGVLLRVNACQAMGLLSVPLAVLCRCVYSLELQEARHLNGTTEADLQHAAGR
jgi:hypothetical protein